jgi:hypothetical protein
MLNYKAELATPTVVPDMQDSANHPDEDMPGLSRRLGQLHLVLRGLSDSLVCGYP